MASPPRVHRAARFGVFEADLQAHELRKHGIKIKLQTKPFQVLALLLEKAGEVVTREDLRERLWPADTFVDFEHGVATAVKKLREALSDSTETPRFVETVPRHGYRFIAPVEFLETSFPRQTAEAAGIDIPPRRVHLRKVGLLALGVALALLAVGYNEWRRYAGSSGPRDRIKLIVLPFKNLNGNVEQEYFCGGLTEELTAQLGLLRPDQLGVIARTTATLYSEGEKPIAHMGEELGVDYVVEGSVRQEGNRLRMTVQLIRVSDQTHVWAESYERDMGSAIGIQREIARRVAESLSVKLMPQEVAQDSRQETSSPVAYTAYMKGRYFRELATERGYRKGIEYFQQAIQEDPSYAPAYAGLAGCYCLLGGHGLELESPSYVMPTAKRMAERALALNERLPEAYGVLGMIQLKYEWDFDRAQEYFQRAVELNPSYAQGHLWYSLYFETLGRSEEAIASAKRAKELDPLSVRALLNLASQYYTARRYDEAIQETQLALEMNPDFWAAHWILGDCLERQGKHDAAIAELESAARGSDSNPAVLASLGYTYAVAGRRERARQTLEEIKSIMKKRYVSPFTVATVHVGLGENDQALEWLERALRARSRSVVWLKVDSRYEPLRLHPRFQHLLGQVNFPE